MLDSVSSIVRLLNVIFFYVLFFAQNFSTIKNLKARKILKLFFSVSIMLIVQSSIERFSAKYLLLLCSPLITILLLIVITYFCLRQDKEVNLKLRINVLLSASNFIAIQFFCAFLDNSLAILIRHFSSHQAILMLVFHNVIEGALSLIIGLISGKFYNVGQVTDKKFDNQIYKIVIGTFIIMFGSMTIYMLIQRLHNYIESFLFLFLIQLFVFWLLYFLISWYKNGQIRNRLITEQLDNLKSYTNYLEREQRKLRKFKHDYQNLLLSLEENLKTTNSTDAKKYIQTFKEYCDSYINKKESLWIFNDFDNIKTPYLKSILINKTFQAIEKKIQIHFECRYDITQIAMEPYDLVRIIGITYDNAIEAVESLAEKDRLINIMIYKCENQIEITFSNPVLEKHDLSKLRQEGVTSKKGHTGFGIANIEEIIGNYSNVLVNYQERNNYFTVQFIIMNKIKKSDI